MASTKISNSFHFPATAGYLLPLRLGLHCRIQHKTPWLSRSQFTCQQYFSGNSMEPGTAQFFPWGRTDTQRNPVYLQSVLGGKHSYGLRSLSKIYFKVSKPTAVYPHPLHSRVTISAGTVLPEKQHYTGTSLWADKALSLTLHITTYSSLHHYYFLSLYLVTSIFPLLSVECFLSFLSSCCYYIKEKKRSRHKEMHTNDACYNPAILTHTAVSAGGASHHPCILFCLLILSVCIGTNSPRSLNAQAHPTPFVNCLSGEKFSCRRDEKN